MSDLFSITAQAVSGLGVEVVEATYGTAGVLQITLDKPGGVTIDDCEQVSRLLSRVYEVENIDYKRLEVGSPGVDRPLRTLADFQRFVGERVQIKLRTPIQNVKVFTGVLQSGEASGFVLHVLQDKTEQHIPFAFEDVEKAKLDPILDFKGKKQ